MAPRKTGAASARTLEHLGIGEQEETAYRWLLHNSGAAVPEIAQALRQSARKTQRLLDMIEAKGLVTHAPQRPRRYFPASPDMALEALILQRQKELQSARAAVQELQEEAKNLRRKDEQEQIIELITSREAEGQTFAHMHRTARHEVVTLIRPPLVISRLDVPSEEDGHPQREAMARGVRFRSIIDTDFLKLEGAVERMYADVKTGEEVRVFPSLPFKLVLADRRIALIPLHMNTPESPALLVRSSALLDALYVLFEILWQRATPISFTRAGLMQTGDPDSRLPQEAEELISLMAAGLNDKAIAHELGLSIRTLNRRIFELMNGLDGRTRFQTGWLAALRTFAAKTSS